jgi:hypothetical protein
VVSFVRVFLVVHDPVGEAGAVPHAHFAVDGFEMVVHGMPAEPEHDGLLFGIHPKMSFSGFRQSGISTRLSAKSFQL